MKIIISYKLEKETDFHQVELNPKEYFDINSLGNGDQYEYNSTPKFLNPIEYLDVIPEQIIQLHLEIKDGVNSLTQFYSYWNKGFCYLLKIIEITQEEKYEELLISTTKTDVKEPFEHLQRNETLRLKKDINGFWIPVLHCTYYDLLTGGTEIFNKINLSNFNPGYESGWHKIPSFP